MSLHGKSLILFGAGHSGGCFIQQNPDLDILAVADNDSEKHGQNLHGIEIIKPSKIVQMSCDAIVITSVWSKSISNQLKELGLEAIPVYIPGKREMKGMRDTLPFSHSATKSLACDMTLWLCRLAKKYSFDLYLDFGTLLGAFRDKDFIAWDDDVDFSIIDRDFDFAVRTITENKNSFPVLPDTQWKIRLMSFNGVGVCLSIKLDNIGFQNSILPFEFSIGRRVRRNGMSVLLGSMPEFYCPEVHFDGRDFVEFLGECFTVPVRAEEYLEYVYGSWRKPRKDFTFADYPSAEIVFDEYKIVYQEF